MGMPQSYPTARWYLPWLGFFKVVPLCLAIATGSPSIARDALVLSGAAVEPTTALWAWLRICFVLSCGSVWFQQHRRLSALEKRLAPRLKIGELEKSIWPFETHGSTGAGYHFTVENLSELETVNHVRAEIIDISPSGAYYPPLPWPMKVKHDNYETREFSINPGATRQLDFVVGPTNDPRCSQPFFIVHTVAKELQPMDSTRKYRIAVRVSADKVTPITAVFEAWVEDGVELRCIEL
jgi:hypothetical protein